MDYLLCIMHIKHEKEIFYDWQQNIYYQNNILER